MATPRAGFTVIEVLVIVLILSILMAAALPLYLRASYDSDRQTCRSNMQTIANAEQAYRVRSSGHVYTADLAQLIGTAGGDLSSLPSCPRDATPGDDYTVTLNDDGTITVCCAADDADARRWHNLVGTDADHGFTPGRDAE